MELFGDSYFILAFNLISFLSCLTAIDYSCTFFFWAEALLFLGRSNLRFDIWCFQV